MLFTTILFFGLMEPKVVQLPINSSITATSGNEIKCRVTSVKTTKPKPESFLGEYHSDYTVYVWSGGKKVKLQRPGKSGYIRIRERGDDGSYLASFGDDQHIYKYMTIYEGRVVDSPVPAASSIRINEYQDRNNYVGTRFPSIGVKGQIESPMILFEVVEGVYREIGWGSYEARVKSGVVTTLLVDWFDRPTDYNCEDHREVWLTKDGINYRVGDEGGITKTGEDSFFITNRNRLTHFDNGVIKSVITFPENFALQFPNGKGDCIISELENQHYNNMSHLFYRGKYRRIHAPTLQDGRSYISSVSWKSDSSFVATVNGPKESKSYLVQLLN